MESEISLTPPCGPKSRLSVLKIVFSVHQGTANPEANGCKGDPVRIVVADPASLAGGVVADEVGHRVVGGRVDPRSADQPGETIFELKAGFLKDRVRWMVSEVLIPDM